MKIKKLQKNKVSGFTRTLSSKVSGFTPTPNFLKKGNLVWGFTLIEIMVATSIFVVVMLIAMGSLIMVSDSAKKAKALNFTMDNLNFAMESMTRSIRMGTNYICSANQIPLGGEFKPASCSSGAGKIAFISSPNFGSNDLSDRIAYDISPRLYPGVGNTIVRCTLSSGNCVDIISENINIDNTSKFYVKGAEKESLGSKIQPSVYMVISGSITIKNEKIPFAIQTIVSQRTLER